MNYRFHLLLLLQLLTSSLFVTVQAQSEHPQLEFWVEQMNYSPSDKVVDSLNYYLGKNPNRNEFVKELKKRGKGTLFPARYYCVLYFITYFNDLEQKQPHDPEPTPQGALREQLAGLLNKALEEAYRTGDERLIAEISSYCGKSFFIIKDYESAMMYLMSGVDLYEKLKLNSRPWDYTVLGELLYKIKDYPASISYSVQALQFWSKPGPGFKIDTGYMTFTSNTTALAYHRQQRYDSAFYYYQLALQSASDLKSDIWKGIVKGNMGQIYYDLKQYDTALAYLLYDYTISKESQLYDNAANSLQWAARVLLAQGNSTTALAYVREAMQLLKIRTDPYYLRNSYFTASEVFRTRGVYDSALHYNKKYELLNDSLERVAAISSIRMSKIKAADEKNRYNIQLLQRQREKQLLQRNILIAAIIVLAVLTLLLLNRQQLKNRIKLEQLEQERLRMQQEAASAKDQLQLITQNIVEKTALIEKLEEQINHSSVSADQEELLTELSRQTILTDDDWNQFKTLFQKIHPTFFNNLRQKAPDITLAEQRLAALTRLQLTTKQMASMLGISVDSVHKSRQRLRSRFQITTEVNLEEYILNI